MEQVGLQHAPPVHRRAGADLDQSASGSQYVSSHTPRPILEPRQRSHRLSTGVPVAARANHGAATSSTKLSTTSLRHTNERPQRVRAPPARARPATTWRRCHRPGHRAGGQQHHTADQPGARETELGGSSASQLEQHADADRRRAPPSGPTGTARPAARAAFSRAGGANVRLRSARPGRSAQLDRRAAQPGRALLGLAGRRRQHRHQRVLRHRPTGRGHPGVAEEGPLADLGRLDPQVAAAELVGADHGVVGQERAVADGGHLRQQQHGRGLHAATDLGAEQPQPGTA